MNKSKQNDIVNVLSKQGRNVIAGTLYDLIQLWKSWYRGDVNSFHRYTEVGVNGNTREREKLTFGLPKRIAEEWSSILWNEKVEISTDNEAVNKQLAVVFENNSHKVEYGNLLEKTFGFAGTGATVQYLADGETIIDYITGEFVIVTQGKDTQAQGLITVNEIEDNDKFITHLTIHTLVNKQYIIEHQAFISDKQTELGNRNSSALRSIFTDETLSTMRTEFKDEEGKLTDVKFLIIYDTDIPFFQLIRPNITNNYDTNSKMGIPVIANSIDVYKALDNAYTSLDYESVFNKTVTVFGEKATKEKNKTNLSDGSTSRVKYIDPNNFSYISSPMNDTEDWVKRQKGEFESEPYVNTIDKNINWGGFKAGLGTKYWGFDGGTVYVNTENVISDNSDIWKNKVKHEIILSKALRDLVRAIVFLEQSQGRMPKLDIKTLDINIKFDDSIIQDDEKLRARDLELVDKGYMPKWAYLVKWESMTETEAKDSIKQAQEEQDNNALDFFDKVDSDNLEDDEVIE